MGDMDLIPLQTKPHSLAESSDVGRQFLLLGPGPALSSWVSCCPENRVMLDQTVGRGGKVDIQCTV